MRAACLFLALLLSACASKPLLPAGPPPPPSPPPLDASYDWHGLLLAPFGSTVKDIPFKLHEVLLFGDQQGSDGAECYGIEREPPRFLERTPDQYLLCFRHDHLARIEATVNVPQASAAQIFADACGLWQKNAALPPASQELPRNVCSGRDQGIGYHGSLDEESEDSDQPLTLRLDGPEQP
jgi:hypothetical protein